MFVISIKDFNVSKLYFYSREYDNLRFMLSPDFFKQGQFHFEKICLEQIFHSGLRASDMNHSESDESTATILKPKNATKRPPLYKVILLNDDFTPMEFVVLVLKRFFSKSQAEAEKIMLEVHNHGSGIAGVFTFEVAETKVFVVNEFSRRQKHPLKCIMEKEFIEEGGE